ncbi:hypothetical protein B0H16DRAFT_1590906 [Mycena metata]|uniref:Uncharacterized protein n=1 Tax=Mycena metata TaxID=1033252 RepID=A0AAD7HSN7_9AGAR|nr:hypothetical protein B0H16DRAFT_1590906 [Mycena metata]
MFTPQPWTYTLPLVRSLLSEAIESTRCTHALHAVVACPTPTYFPTLPLGPIVHTLVLSLYIAAIFSSLSVALLPIPPPSPQTPFLPHSLYTLLHTYTSFPFSAASRLSAGFYPTCAHLSNPVKRRLTRAWAHTQCRSHMHVGMPAGPECTRTPILC